MMNEINLPAQLPYRDMDRVRGYQEFLDFYHGKQWEGRDRYGEKRLTFNYTKVFIDKVASYLMSGVKSAVDAVNSTRSVHCGHAATPPSVAPKVFSRRSSRHPSLCPIVNAANCAHVISGRPAERIVSALSSRC